MLISPPFLPPRAADQTEDQWLEAAMPGGEPGNGAYPVSYNLGWHGGLHLTAPPRGNSGVELVRAIADGTVVYRRGSAEPPAPPEENAPLNYRGRTSDGVVVIRHETEIGVATTGNAPTRVVFFSIYMHLHTVRSTVQQGRRIYRKDELGQAGYIGGRPNQIHFEIVCDDTNLRQLIGRVSGDVPLAGDGRSDAIFGELYFHLAADTQVFPQHPPLNQPSPPGGTPLGEEVFVGVRYAEGDGAQGARGHAYVTTYRLTGLPLGDAVTEAEAEYNRKRDATQICDAYPANARPSPSAVYELLRFGRVIGPDALSPADVPHWRKIRTPTGTGWVNLNAQGVRKFSDADFPHWRGWRLVEDAQGGDSLCSDPAILRELDGDHDDTITAEEAHTRLDSPEVKALLKKLICKFPTEWEAATIEARWGWLKQASPTNSEPMTEEQFQALRAHIEALAFWQQANLQVPQYDAQGQPSGGQPLPNAHWRFDPREFVRIFRRCGWLNADEMARCFPRRLLHLTGTQFVPHSTTWNVAHARSIAWVLPFNQATRKYGLSISRQRLLHFFAHVIPETGNLHFVKEINGESKTYTPYYGRGLIQLTHLENYLPYGRFRKFPATVTTGQFSGLGWDPDVFIARNNEGDHNAYNCADSACFYVATRAGMLSHMDAGVGQDNAVVVSKDVNGNVSIENLNGLDARLQAVLYLRNALLDDVFPDQMLPLTFEWRRNTQKEPVFDAQGNPVMVGNPPLQKKKFYPTQHTISVSLELQRP